MNPGRLIAVVFLTAACAANARTQTAETAVGGDDPLSCVDDPRPHASQSPDLRKPFEETLKDLGTCTQTLTTTGSIQVSLTFHADGTPKGVRVTRSTVQDCAAVECVRRGLANVTVPAVVEGTQRRLVSNVNLVPRVPPRSVNDVNWERSTDASACVGGSEHDEFDEAASGRLPPEQIQRIVRERYAAIRSCYENGLARNPALRGRVMVRFVISHDGNVSSAHVATNELPDCKVTACVRDEIRKCIFPRPERGIVTVVYPIFLEPG